MRWIYFLILTLLGVILQTTLVQLVWFRTGVGWIGPEILAMVAVFVALHVRSTTDAALAGWALGFALDLTLSGTGMGLLGLLYAAGAVGVHRMRGAVLGERGATQMLLAFIFCMFVYQLWTLYDVWAGAGGPWGTQALQVVGLSAYTAILTPLACGGLRRIGRLLLVAPAGRGRR